MYVESKAGAYFDDVTLVKLEMFKYCGFHSSIPFVSSQKHTLLILTSPQIRKMPYLFEMFSSVIDSQMLQTYCHRRRTKQITPLGDFYLLTKDLFWNMFRIKLIEYRKLVIVIKNISTLSCTVFSGPESQSSHLISQGTNENGTMYFVPHFQALMHCWRNTNASTSVFHFCSRDNQIEISKEITNKTEQISIKLVKNLSFRKFKHCSLFKSKSKLRRYTFPL